MKAFVTHVVSGMVACLFLTGCSVMDYAPAFHVEHQAGVVLLPIVNHTETPQAGRRVEAITAALLYSRGVTALHSYPGDLRKKLSHFDSDDELLSQAMAWAQSQDARYALTGTVDEWRYKVGIDGEPAVGVSFRLVDLKARTVVWSGVGGKTGWSREAVSAVAQTLIKDLLSEVTFL